MPEVGGATGLPLFGRELESKLLADLVSGIRDRGGAVFLSGEAGIGKSALLAEAGALAAAAGLRVLRTTGAEAEQHLPLAGLHQILHPIRSGLETLPGPQRDALQSAMGLADSAVADLYLVGLAVLNLLAEVAAETPVVLIAEDVHWLDQVSADVLAFVARRLESEPIVLIGAGRDRAESQLLSAGLPSLMVEPLAAEPAAALLVAVAPELDQAVRTRLLAEAAGNPLALTELPGTVFPDSLLKATLPLSARLEQAFGTRAATLPAATRTSLLVASLNDGDSVAEVLAAAATVLGTEVEVDVLTPAAEAGLIELRSSRLTFRHPLMRSAISQATGAVQRRAAQQALAEVLADQPDRRTWHLAAAASGPDEGIAVELEAAAYRAQRRGGVAAAIEALQHAARLSEAPDRKADRVLLAADLAVEYGDRELVQRLLAEVSPADLSPQQRARATWIRSSFDDGLSEDTAGPIELARLAESVASDGDLDLAMRILWGAGMRCFWTEPGPEARQVLMDVADSLPIDERDPRLLAISAYVAPVERGKAVAVGLMDLAGSTGGDPQVERFLGSAALQIGAFELSARFSAGAAAGLRPQGRLGLLTRALAVQAWSSTRLGNLAVALPAAEEAARLGRETNQQFMYGLAVAVQAEIAALRGDYEAATSLAAEAEQVGIAAGARPVLATVQLARGLTALGEGRYADAFADLRRIHDPADPAYQVALRCYIVAELAEAAVRSGQIAEMRDIVRDLQQTAASTTSPALRIGLRYVSAVLAEGDEAETLFKAALDADLRGWPLERGRVQLAFGEWLRRHRRTADSRVHLRAARETFDALGVIPWSERARAELRAAGETSPRRTPDARDHLTPHELSIAQLASEGLTNREIGQRLYLSHRTVSTHLHRIFPKLGISARGDLAAALGPLVEQ